MKGLDIGTAFIVCMEEQEGKGQVIRSERDAFFQVPEGEFTKNMLNQSGVNYIKIGTRLFVIGDKAMEFAEVFGTEARRPLARGYISPREQDALPVLKEILKAVLGRPSKDEKLVFSVPSETLDDMERRNSLIYHRGSLDTILRQLGYTPTYINEALAVIYSELQDYQFSGIGMSWGAGMINFCATWLSVPIPELTFAVSRGGDWIDENAALALSESTATVCNYKEHEFDLLKNYDIGIPQALQVYYKELMRYALMYLETALKKLKRRFPAPLPIVVSGGTTSPPGFIEMLTETVNKCVFTNFKGEAIEIDKVIKASKPLYSVAKGCLIKGIIDGE